MSGSVTHHTRCQEMKTDKNDRLSCLSPRASSVFSLEEISNNSLDSSGASSAIETRRQDTQETLTESSTGDIDFRASLNQQLQGHLCYLAWQMQPGSELIRYTETNPSFGSTLICRPATDLLSSRSAFSSASALPPNLRGKGYCRHRILAASRVDFP